MEEEEEDTDLIFCLLYLFINKQINAGFNNNKKVTWALTIQLALRPPLIPHSFIKYMTRVTNYK
jgi:hypothetical protein